MTKTKICKKCGEEKELTEFYKSKTNIDGFCGSCKKCDIKRSRLWEINNPEECKERNKKYYQEHKEKWEEYVKRWTKNNPKKRKEISKKWIKNNPEKNKECKKKWIENNPEKNRECKIKYKINNPEKVKQCIKKCKKENLDGTRWNNKRRRSRKKGAEGSHTEQEWQDKKKEYGYRCVYCGIHETVLKKKYKDKRWWLLTEDHEVALDNGGTDYIENIVPACISCNSSKKDKII